ncbi:MAG: hypothetical protein KME54_08905 [Tolypothrix brevis GSE-NOS-MK-07-07A]|nr:hypothetical protein [Tolypothrix brevis GSE-NOS-MK-07-07A]
MHTSVNRCITILVETFRRNVFTSGTSLQAERLYKRNVFTSRTSLQAERLYKPNVFTSRTSLQDV